jgi:hypothetical protein
MPPQLAVIQNPAANHSMPHDWNYGTDRLGYASMGWLRSLMRDDFAGQGELKD